MLFQFVKAAYGERLSFNQLRKQGGIQFPGEGVMLPQFSQPSLVPKVNLPPAFIFAARGRPYSLRVNETEDENEMTSVVNTVWNNIESYLPNRVIEEDEEKEGLR